MPVQISYPIKYTKSTYFNSDSIGVGFTTSSGNVIYAESPARIDGNVYVTEIDEGTTSPTSDYIGLSRIYTPEGTSNGVSLYSFSGPQNSLNPSFRFQYSDTLINPTEYKARLRVDVSGFIPVITAEVYGKNGNILGVSSPVYGQTGTSTMTFTCTGLPVLEGFKPEVKFTLHPSGINLTTGQYPSTSSFAIIASELEASGTSAFVNNFVPCVIFGEVEDCNPVFELEDNDDTQVDYQLGYSYLERYRIPDTSGRYNYSNFNSFGTRYTSGNLGSHFYLREGSGKYIYSNDNAYSGEVTAALGTITQPIWLFNNKKIAGQKVGIASSTYNTEVALPHLSDSQITVSPGSEGTPASIEVTFYTSTADIPSHSHLEPPEVNQGGGTTDFKLIDIPGYSDADPNNPSYTWAYSLNLLDANIFNSGLAVMESGLNSVAPYNSTPLEIVGDFANSKFTINFPNGNPASGIAAGIWYGHFSDGALYGPYDDDFYYTFYPGTEGSEGSSGIAPVYQYSEFNAGYQNLYHNSNCLRLGTYSYSGEVSFSEPNNVVPSSIAHLNLFKRLPDDDFSLVLLYNNLNNNYYYLNNYERGSTTDFCSSMTFGLGNDIKVTNSGDFANYPLFTQSLLYRNSSNAVAVESRQYNIQNWEERFTGQMLTYQSGRLYLYNVKNNGSVEQVLETPSFTRFATSEVLKINPNQIFGLSEIIISSGNVIYPDVLERYLKNNINNLSIDTNPASFTTSSNHIVHRGPNSVNHLYSGDIGYSLGDYIVLDAPQTYYSVPSGNNIILEAVVQYSGYGACHINPWIELDFASNRYVWTPTYSGYGVQPSLDNRGLRILNSSGIHKVTFIGEHKIDSPYTLESAKLYFNISYPESGVSYYGGDLRVYSAKLYSNDGLCSITDSINTSINLTTFGHEASSSGIPLFVSGQYVATNNVNLSTFGHIPSSSGLDLTIFTGTPANSGIDLFIMSTTTTGELPLFIGNYPAESNSGLHLYMWSSDGSGIQGGLNLYMVSRGLSNTIPLYIANSDTHNNGSGYIPLFIANDSSVQNTLNLYLESVRESGAALNLYTAGLGDTLGGFVAGSGIPLFIARDSEGIAGVLPMYVSGPNLANSNQQNLMIKGQLDFSSDSGVDNAFGTSVYGFPVDDSGSILYDITASKFVPIYIHGF